MNYQDAKRLKEHLELMVNAASDVLNTYPKLGNGLVPDSIRSSNNYTQAKANYDKAFKALRNFNKVFVKQFKKEIKEDRKLSKS